MITGQILIYHFNGLHNAKPDIARNQYQIKDVSVETPVEFKNQIIESLDQVPPGKGYVLIRWKEKTFIAEKDTNNPEKDYVRHEITYHPLLSVFKD
jgi:hypothetical protein